MAKQYELTGVLATFEASEALTSGALVIIDSNGKAKNATGAYGVGVTYESASSGENVAIALGSAIIEVKANGNSTNIAAGDLLKWDATNKVFVKAGSGDKAVAMALEPATADGLYISAITGLYVEVA